MIDVMVRKATKADAPDLLRLIDALAGYERLAPPDAAAKDRLVSDMFRENPRVEAFLAEADDMAVGYAIIFETYSSFLALPTLYLEDLFVLPEYRGKGVGYRLFKAIVAEAHHRGCGRMEWAVLDWNSIANDFYNRLGAARLNEWQYYRLTGDDFERILKR